MGEIEDLVFNVKYKIFQVLTFGWVANILLFVCVLVLFMSLFALLSHYKIIKFSMIEKFLFAKNYLYLVMIQNTTFIKFWVYEILHQYNKSKTIYIVTAIVAIVLILLYIYIKSVE